MAGDPIRYAKILQKAQRRLRATLLRLRPDMLSEEERRQAEKEAKRPEKRSWDLRAAMMKCINTCMPVKKFKSQYLPGYAVGRSRLRRLIDSIELFSDPTRSRDEHFEQLGEKVIKLLLAETSSKITKKENHQPNMPTKKAKKKAKKAKKKMEEKMAEKNPQLDLNSTSFEGHIMSELEFHQQVLAMYDPNDVPESDDDRSGSEDEPECFIEHLEQMWKIYNKAEVIQRSA